MTDFHPEARTLAEVLERWVPAPLLDQALADVLAALASHPPAGPGWVDITADEIRDELEVGAGTPILAAEAARAVNAIARRRFAERASGEEGGA